MRPTVADRKRVVILRHAEVSDDPEDPHLAELGRRRAEALSYFIPATFGPPGRIFCATSSQRSHQCYETIFPLSQVTGAVIDGGYADCEYKALATLLRSNYELHRPYCVVCWHHGNIPNLLHSLRVREGLYPNPWSQHVFDLMLDVTLRHGWSSTIDLVRQGF